MKLKWRINLLALLGAIIGVISIFLPWGGGGTLGEGNFYWNLIEIGNLINPAVAILFILGTGLSFITSLGAVIQFISFVSGGTDYWFLTGGISPWVYGYIFALISFSLIVLSIFLCITVPPLEKPYSLKMRLLTFARINKPDYPVQTNDKPNVEDAQ